VEPNRLDAARAAATTFTEVLPPEFNLGLVSFAGTATVAVSPTTDREAVTDAIAGLELSESTAIGEAVLASLGSIDAMARRSGLEAGSDAATEEADEPEVPASIVVMSDGETTVGTPNEIAAADAKEAGVPVTTIGFGTDEGTITYEGEVVPVPVNEEELAQLAETTGGNAFVAATGDELQSAYEDIGSLVGYETEQREIGRWFVGAAFALMLLSSVASLAWFSRLP
ncbi:MAG: VWA domain-containing protein, partial [Actinomycetota bacterium]|nr:VWA domain-containing protein [Actinomycetota bacterium]